MGWQRNRITGGLRQVPDGPQPWIGKPADPTEPYKAQGAQLDNQGKAADIQNDAERLRLERERLLLARQNADIEAQLKAAQLAEENRKAAAADPYNAQQLSSAATDAREKLESITRIGQFYKNSNLPVIGTGAETLAQYGGTGAANVEAELGTLKAGGALSEILKMSQATGKNPFTPMSNSDVELIARNKGNLSQKSGPDSFFPNLGNYQKAYTNAYVGARGQQALNDETKGFSPALRKKTLANYQRDPRATGVDGELLPRPLAREINARVAEYKQENPGATYEQVLAYRKYMSEQALPNYRERQEKRRSGTADAPPKSTFEFLGFED